MANGDWCILRTGGGSTLQLAKSLAEAGYEAWTPVESALKKPKLVEFDPWPRKLPPPKQVTQPMIPTFVFARGEHVIDLLKLSRSPALNYRVWDAEQRKMVVRGHPGFSVFCSFDGTPQLIRDRDLDALRLSERRRKPRGKVRPVSIGDRVRLTGGSFEGLRGVVEAVRGKFAEVAFPGFRMPATIGCWLLTLDIDAAATVHVKGYHSEQAPLARAA